MAESDYSGGDHSFGSQYTSNMCENNQSGNALISQLTSMKFQEQFATKLSVTPSSDAAPSSSSQEEVSSLVMETSSPLKSMASTRTLDFEKIFSVVESVLFNPSEMEENNDDTETCSPELKEVQRPSFQSKFLPNLPLYQHYCMQNVREDIQRFKKSSMTELISPLRVHGLRAQIEKFYQSQTCSPQCNPSPAPVCLTPPPNPSPIRVTPCSSLWQDLEEVKESGLLPNLSLNEIRLHETSFELICSEASYLRSLDIAVNHFFASKALRQTLTQMEHHILFSNIQQVMGASEKFLMDLELRLGECILVGSQVGNVVLQHCPSFHRLYVPYVTNMMYQEALIRQLLQKNKDFQRVLAKLEESPVCQRHNLKSFLVLPFQRITRIKLILETIFKLAEPGSNSLTNLDKAIQAVHEVVQECNSGVQKMKRIEELVYLEMLLDFGKVKAIPLVTNGRFLKHQGPMKQLCLESSVNSKMSFTNIYLHLLSDMLIISSKRDEQFEVLDVAEFPTHIRCEHFKAEALGLPPNSFLLHLSKRQTGAATVLVLVPDTRSAKETWINVLSSKIF